MGAAHLAHLEKRPLKKQNRHDSHITHPFTHAAQIIYTNGHFIPDGVTSGKIADSDL
jgi:hypothetical protein